MSDQQESHTKTILLVEDTPSLSKMYETYLRNQGYVVNSVLTAYDALQFIEAKPPSVVLLDIKLPDMSGLEVMDEFNRMQYHGSVIIITGNGSINTAVQAMQKGAQDFLVKPFNVERLEEAISKVFGMNQDKESGCRSSAGYAEDDLNTAAGLNYVHDHIEKAETRTSYPEDTSKKNKKSFGGFIGTSRVMQDLYAQIENAALSHAPVFITGESGTGKEVCAEAIHKHSKRSEKPFVPINCAAIPKDLIESELFGHVKGAFTGAVSDRDGAAKLADGGTLFLDEIGETDPGMQSKLLRFLQNYSFQRVGGNKLETTDARIVCATNRNPMLDIQTGRFREDLFYRLHVIPIHMPPLRERGDDIVDIAQAFLWRYSREEDKRFRGFTEEAEQLMKQHNWPGNIRELQNFVRQIVVMHNRDIVTPDMLPAHIRNGNTYYGQAVSGQDYSLNATLQPEPQRSGNGTGYAGNGTEFTTGTFPGNNGNFACGGRANGASSTGAQFPPDRFRSQEKGFAPKTNQLEDIKPLWMAEKEIIEQAIEICNGNIPRAAALLEISPSTIYRKKLAWEENEKQSLFGNKQNLS